MLAFLLQKKHWLLFDESNNEGMVDLLKATPSPLRITVELYFEAEEA